MALGRRDLLAGGCAALVFAASAHAEASAAETVAQETALAAQDGKRLLLVFEASWCVWCKQMDAMLKHPDAAAILGRHFRIAHLRALERDDAEIARQLPGADDVYLQYAGGQNGLPFTAVLDAEAQAIATSITAATDGKNFGFPVLEHELDGFERLIEIAAPGSTPDERATLRAVCVRVMDG